MAKPIICDADDCGADAVVMVSDLSDGTVTSFCAAHWLGCIEAMWAELNQAADEAEWEREHRLTTLDDAHDDDEGDDGAATISVPAPQPEPEPVALPRRRKGTEHDTAG